MQVVQRLLDKQGDNRKVNGKSHKKQKVEDTSVVVSDEPNTAQFNRMVAEVKRLEGLPNMTPDKIHAQIREQWKLMQKLNTDRSNVTLPEEEEEEDDDDEAGEEEEDDDKAAESEEEEEEEDDDDDNDNIVHIKNKLNEKEMAYGGLELMSDVKNSNGEYRKRKATAVSEKKKKSAIVSNSPVPEKSKKDSPEKKTPKATSDAAAAATVDKTSPRSSGTGAATQK
eukprot:4573342-Prymnesium_polylepis.1